MTRLCIETQVTKTLIFSLIWRRVLNSKFNYFLFLFFVFQQCTNEIKCIKTNISFYHFTPWRLRPRPACFLFHANDSLIYEGTIFVSLSLCLCFRGRALMLDAGCYKKKIEHRGPNGASFIVCVCVRV